MQGLTIGGFERLQEYVAHGAFHDSGERFDPPKCHQNTRVAIIKRITEWISGLNEDTQEALIMWLYGAAGAGKSAIAQTIAEILHGQQFFLASFFFSRNDPQRGVAKWLVTTLAYQLAVRLPQVFRERVSLTFEQDPLIVTRSLEAQFMALVREPLLKLVHSGFLTNNHIIVIIDGLDECDDPKVQAKLVDLSFDLLRGQDLPLKILIASRPEMDISSSFDRKPFSMLARIALDHNYQADRDILHFLADKFNEIKTQHRLSSYIPIGWPAEDSLNILVRKSSGQFIYASTVVKYIASPRHRPTHRLEIVLGIQLPKAGDSPFAELDALYRHILMGVEDVDLLLQIIGFFVFHPPLPPNPVTFIEGFLSLAPGDVQLLMQNIGSLISIEHHPGYPDGSVLTVRLLHASLKDYLLDRSRSKDFFLDRLKMHTHYAELCLTHMMELPSLESNSPHHPFTDPVNGPWPIFTHFFHHCPLAKPNPQLLQHTLHLTLNRCHTILGVTGRYDTFFSREYFFYLDSLSSIWADSAISQFYADEIVALEQLIKAQLGPYPPRSHICFLLASIMNEDSPPYYVPDAIFLGKFLGNTSRTAPLGCTLNFLTDEHPVLRKHLHNTLQDWIISTQHPSDTTSVYTSAAFFALRYILTCAFPYASHTTRFGRSCHYHRTRMNNPAQSLWYRRSVNTAYKMYYTNDRYIDFVQAAGKGAFIDAQFHPIRWYRFNTGEAFHAYFWALKVLPPLLGKSGYSEELVAYARKAGIMRSNDYLNFIYPQLAQKWRSAQAAVKAYLRGAEHGKNLIT
ncbi:hypothetical protein CVT25_005268 [Psilocybe cyanescens]|uniref:Nephrocystin 3-like N-terminal domain-containing protein n=1 Tax=Psilocybe cyanescens TaxID=93625 RepID=A0A409XDV1_PSICY|nr:hypothetical protein CVT25_005268 [Psilocybe cyanescens]